MDYEPCEMISTAFHSGYSPIICICCLNITVAWMILPPTTGSEALLSFNLISLKFYYFSQVRATKRQFTKKWSNYQTIIMKTYQVNLPIVFTVGCKLVNAYFLKYLNFKVKLALLNFFSACKVCEIKKGTWATKTRNIEKACHWERKTSNQGTYKFRVFLTIFISRQIEKEGRVSYLSNFKLLKQKTPMQSLYEPIAYCNMHFDVMFVWIK